jgi:flavin reductase (DIM6/NTAB) family NADH-FMN oxidoreductase RutF
LNESFNATAQPAIVDVAGGGLSLPPMVTSDEFRQVMGNFATGITVVTTYDGRHVPYGLTVNSFTSVSLNPVQVLVCLDNNLSGLQHFQNNKKFGISILSEFQEDRSRTFAKKDSERPETMYFEGSYGTPLLHNSLATLECELVAAYPGGDHVIMLGEVHSADVHEGKHDIKPLLYFRGKYHKLS